MTGDTSFWYPSMELFRQRERGNWVEVTDRVATALAAFVGDPKVYFNLGNARKEQGEFQAAIDAYRQALTIHPEYPEAHNNLGTALHEQGNLQAVIHAYRRALAIRPNFPESRLNLGIALRRQGRIQAAIHAYRQALAINPNFPEAFANLGHALRDQGELQAAMDAYHQALAINPDFPDVHWNLSHLQLLLGDYENGWKGYEWRFRVKDLPQQQVPPHVERWDGDNLAPGENLLLMHEGGLGDTLHFMRYVLHLNNTGQSASLCAPIKLHGLIRTSGITTRIYSRRKPAVPCHPGCPAFAIG